MTVNDLWTEAFSSLTGNRLRSGLTALGIIIGVAAVIAMVSIGQGATQSVTKKIEAIGANLLIVIPGAPREPGFHPSAGRGTGQMLKEDDATAISQNISLVQAVAPELTRPWQIIGRGTNTLASVVGTTPDYASIRQVTVSQGVFLSWPDQRNFSRVAVLGPTARDDLLGPNRSAIGQTIKINQVEFRVIGITKSKGAAGTGSEDNLIYIPLAAAQRFLSGENFVTAINIKVNKREVMTQAKNKVNRLLLSRHHLKSPTEADFTILNQADIAAAASAITGLLTWLLGSIASISLAVGGIGIMNMMFTTVTERTREIGLRQALGATRRDIAKQFLIEAVTLTTFGGLLGVPLGWFLSLIFGRLAGVEMLISFSSIILAVGIAALIGIIFGYLPARRASLLNPIDALRHD